MQTPALGQVVKHARSCRLLPCESVVEQVLNDQHGKRVDSTIEEYLEKMRISRYARNTLFLKRCVSHPSRPSLILLGVPLLPMYFAPVYSRPVRNGLDAVHHGLYHAGCFYKSTKEVINAYKNSAIDYVRKPKESEPVSEDNLQNSSSDDVQEEHTGEPPPFWKCPIGQAFVAVQFKII